jgi:hypothetical protein
LQLDNSTTEHHFPSESAEKQHPKNRERTPRIVQLGAQLQKVARRSAKRVSHSNTAEVLSHEGGTQRNETQTDQPKSVAG